MQIVVISDTHGAHRDIELPCADVLIHAGDITLGGEKSVTLDFVDWFSETPFTHKLFIAGNHDHWAEQEGEVLAAYAAKRGVHYLHSSAVNIDGTEFWGSPYTPRFMNWSFMLTPGNESRNHWQQIPENVNVLITHGPPLSILDSLQVADGRLPVTDEAQASASGLTSSGSNISLVERNVGCDSLAQRVSQIAPDVHVFGHIHESYGQCVVDGTHYINASLMDADYRLAHLPQYFSLDEDFRASAIRQNDRIRFASSAAGGSAALAVDAVD